jgi:hypothetical protein
VERIVKALSKKNPNTFAFSILDDESLANARRVIAEIARSFSTGEASYEPHPSSSNDRA